MRGSAPRPAGRTIRQIALLRRLWLSESSSPGLPGAVPNEGTSTLLSCQVSCIRQSSDRQALADKVLFVRTDESIAQTVRACRLFVASLELGNDLDLEPFRAGNSIEELGRRDVPF